MPANFKNNNFVLKVIIILHISYEALFTWRCQGLEWYSASVYILQMGVLEHINWKYVAQARIPCTMQIRSLHEY